jgi:GPH family glycoside/pentoside/hexuronide:cation symporter
MAEAAMTPEKASAHPPRAVRASHETSLWTRFAYGFGSVAFGVKDNGFSYFLLIFYSQVVGVDSRLVSAAISIALIFDAFTDPLVGYFSDNLRSGWGRRHPLMYTAAIPASISYLLLWRPPHWSQGALFWYLLVLAIAIRIMICVFETPSSALGAELAAGYDERSRLMSWRYYFGWTGGNFMSVLMFGVLFPAFATKAAPNGQFHRDAYALYGVIASALIFTGIMVSALGTHARIPYLHAPPAKRRLTPLVVLREIWETLSNRSFFALFLSTTFGSIAGGLSAALAFYFLTYFWGFSAFQNFVITASVFLSAFIGAIVAPMASRTIGKKRGAIVLGFVAFGGSPVPVLLRLFGVLPPNGTPFIFWLVLLTTMVDVGLIIAFSILGSAMMADLVEQAELKTGRRAEGVFFSAASFIRKLVSGVGIIAAGQVLWLAHFPKGADPAHVPAQALFNLGAYYVPTILTLWMSMVAVILFYRVDRKSHEENLRKLAEAKR